MKVEELEKLLEDNEFDVLNAKRINRPEL